MKMELIDEIAQIIRINDKVIGAGRTAELIVKHLAENKYGKMELDCCYLINGKCTDEGCNSEEKELCCKGCPKVTTCTGKCMRIKDWVEFKPIEWGR